jgi:hypothetical protein
LCTLDCSMGLYQASRKLWELYSTSDHILSESELNCLAWPRLLKETDMNEQCRRI